MIERFILWLDDRLGSASFMKHALRKAFPDHWSFMLGEVAMYCFFVLVATGIFLGFFFDPTGRDVVYQGTYAPLVGQHMSGAYASMLRLSFEVNAGLLFRQIHHWAAVVFVAAIVSHIMRIFFTGAFRRPRELNWLIGMTLLVLALGAGFTGYSLPDDLLSGTGLRIAYTVLQSIPVVGLWSALLAFGGTFPSSQMTSRLFFTHVFLLPLLIIGALSVHLFIVWRQKHTQFRGPNRTELNVVGSPLWPRYTIKSIGLAMAVVAVLAGLGAFFQINPIWIYGPYESYQVSWPAQPDWYVGWLEGALRLGPAWLWRIFGHPIGPQFMAGVLLPLSFLILLYLWPFIERWATGDGNPHHLLDRPSDSPPRLAIGAALLAFALVLTLAASNDVQARLLRIPVETLTNVYRFLLILAPLASATVGFTVARELKRKHAEPESEPARVVIRRTPQGGFETEPDTTVPFADGPKN